MSSAEFSSTSYSPDRLIAGDFPIVTAKVTIDTGNLARGSVLGRITATGKYVLSAAAAGDGSEVPRAILAEAVDATAADKEAIVYLSGEFNEDRVTLGAGHTLASIRDGLRDLDIHLKGPIATA